MALSGKAKAEMLKMETRAKFPYLIKIEYKKSDNTIEMFYFANCDDDIVYDGHTYVSSVFSIQPPEKKSDSISDAKLSISAIDQVWIEKIRSTKKRAKATFTAVISIDDDETTVESIEEEEFELTLAQWNDTSISWNMEFDTLSDVQCPLDETNIFNTPSLG